MITGDYNALVTGQSPEQKHAVTITIANVDLVPRKCFQQPFTNHATHHAGPFDDKNKFWMNLHQRVFRARGQTAELSICDWASDDNPGGPVGQELMYNFIEVQPFFE